MAIVKPAARRWLVWIALFAAVTWVTLYLQPNHEMEPSRGDNASTRQ
jgi:hypothetical protein